MLGGLRLITYAGAAIANALYFCDVADNDSSYIDGLERKKRISYRAVLLMNIFNTVLWGASEVGGLKSGQAAAVQFLAGAAVGQIGALTYGLIGAGLVDEVYQLIQNRRMEA